MTYNINVIWFTKCQKLSIVRSSRVSGCKVWADIMSKYTARGIVYIIEWEKIHTKWVQMEYKMREYFVMKLASSQWTSTLLDIPVMTTAQKHSYIDGRLAFFSIAFFSLELQQYRENGGGWCFDITLGYTQRSQHEQIFLIKISKYLHKFMCFMEHKHWLGWILMEPKRM